ncbi:MAG TPA: ATP-binding protein [Actinomycetota bacterium]|nr:ATP-binding protein [Actinomycetota bacterium]
MWDIASTLRRRWIEVAWGAFAATNVAVIVLLSRWETIPFHFVWVSLTLVYGFRRWRLRTTIGLLIVVIAVTGGALAWSIVRGHEGPDELAEVPLMAAMFVAMVWHAERRQAAVEEARRLAESEHQLLLAQREFVRDASHELRTPITVARGHAELIRDLGNGDQTVEDAEVIIDELGHLSRLSERLLLLTTAGHPGFLARAPLDIGAFVEALARRWTRAADRDWRIGVDAHGTVPADRERLETAFDGLLENAVAATGRGDEIRLSCRAEGATVVLEVHDGGIGIRATDLPRIFDRFARVEVDRGRSNGGTGLGLSITKAIVEAHGGTIEVESREGAGTTFRVRLLGFRPQDVTIGLGEAARIGGA